MELRAVVYNDNLEHPIELDFVAVAVDSIV